MPSPDSQSIQPTRDSLDAAERLQHALRCAVAGLEATKCRLLYDVRGFAPTDPPLIDGLEARVNGDSLDVVSWLQSRVEDLALKGPFAEALAALEREATHDATEALARYVRENRPAAPEDLGRGPDPILE